MNFTVIKSKLFLLCSVFTGFFPDFSGTESRQNSVQEQGVFGVIGWVLEWGSDMGGSIAHRSRDVSRGRGRVCVKKGYFFQTSLCDMLALLTFYLRPCPFLFRSLSVRDTFIYANNFLFSNYGINKAWPPKANIKEELNRKKRGKEIA